MYTHGLILLLILSVINYTVEGHIPIIFLHGLTDDPSAFDEIISSLRANDDDDGIITVGLPHDYSEQDSFENLWFQAIGVAQSIRHLVESNPTLYANGYHLVGHSQGGLLARVIAETMDDHHIINLVSLAGPQMGISLPLNWLHDLYDGVTSTVRNFILKFNKNVEQSSVGNMLHDKEAFESRDITNFFTLLNNGGKYDKYSADLKEFGLLTSSISKRKSNFLKVQEAHFFYSPEDTVIRPASSAIFSYYNNNNLTPMRELYPYVEDTFGLRTMDESGKLFLHEVHDVCHNCWLRDIPTEPLLYKVDHAKSDSSYSTDKQLIRDILYPILTS